MMKKHYLSFILSFVLVVFMSSQLNAVAEKAPAKGTSYTESHIKLKYRMQELWIEHAWWTRSFIVSSLAGIEDQQAVLNRLLQNQVDIGDTIKPYYGEEAGTKLTALLNEHILIAGSIVEAAKKGDQANVDKLNKEWTRNADQIVAFLSSANPKWNKKELTDMFYLHLKLTNDEVVDRLKKDWENDIRTADRNEEHLIHMADFLTDGIVKQFPKKFK
ncbi:glycosyltransferase [Neobacillus sp. D3-1R]|uniref:glycosyltransferase n=1 Tax=Neobacillus sp. D3-1R TaxID=3445778 RepID=UPI003FA14B02